MFLNSYGQPEGCQRDACEFYVEWRDNEEFVDFRMEGNGDGWIAMGITSLTTTVTGPNNVSVLPTYCVYIYAYTTHTHTQRTQHTHTHIYTHTHQHTHTHTETNTHTHIHTHTHIYTHQHTHTHANTHTHLHTHCCSSHYKYLFFRL